MAICPNIGCRSCNYQRKLCDRLGKEYSIRTIDMERVINCIKTTDFLMQLVQFLMQFEGFGACPRDRTVLVKTGH